MRPERRPLVLAICRAVVSAASLLVPPRSRPAWRREWEAELAHRWADLDDARALDLSGQAGLVRRALGALPDAAWLGRQVTWPGGLLHDVRHGVRVLRSGPGFTAIAVVILAVGVGVTTAMFSLADTLLFRPLPYPDADRIVTVWETHTRRGMARDDVAPANFLDWRERARGFTTMAAVEPYSFDLTASGQPEVVIGALVTEGFFQVLGVEPVLGRLFTPDDHQAGRPRVALLSWAFWQRRFAGEPGVVGKAIVLDGAPTTVVGVLPRDLDLGLLPTSRERGLWLPKIIQDHDRLVRTSGWWNVVARLKPDVDLEIANAEMRAIAGTLASEYPRSNTDTGALVIPLFDFMVGSVRRAVLILLGAVGLVLMVACANVANVQLARGFDRQRELAIRAALGAGRARIVRQLLVESGMLAVLACAGGFATARWLVNLVVALGPADVPRLHQVALDVRVLAVTATVAVVTAIAFGLVPALQLSRAEFVAGVREGGRATGPASRRRARNVLLASEVAVALVLLVGAGLLVRSFGRLLAIDPGFRQENVLALQVFAWERNNGPDRLTLYFERCLERLRALPDAVAVGAVSAMPFIEANINIQSVMLVANRPAPAAGEEPRVFVTVATPGYFQAMRVPLVRGRLLDDRDSRQAPPVALVSRSLARHYWPGTDPVGDHVTVRWEGRARTVEIVGVVVDVRHDGLDRPPREEVFLPFAQAPFGSMTFVVRTAGDPAGGIQAATDAIWAVDSLQTIYDTATVDRLVSASLKPRRFTLLMLGVSALIALSLTLAGVYGVMAVTTRQRTREIGVRVALGAGRRDIVRMVIGQGLQPVLAGAVIGLTGALAAGRVLEGLLFETTPFDPTTVAGVAVLLVAAAAAACYLPARRATRVDPLIALRAE